MKKYVYILSAFLILSCVQDVAQAASLEEIASEIPAVTSVDNKADALITRIESEVEKIVSAGHLRPFRCEYGESDGYTGPDHAGWFYEPWIMMHALARVYPYVSPTLQTQITSYVQNEYSLYTPWGTTPLDATNGALRQSVWFDFYESSITRSSSGYDRSGTPFYSMWLYGHQTEDWTQISNDWSSIRSAYSAVTNDAGAINYEMINGAIAMSRMAAQFGDASLSSNYLDDAVAMMTAGRTFETFKVNAFQFYTGYDEYVRGTAGLGYPLYHLSPETARYINEPAQAALKADVHDFLNVYTNAQEAGLPQQPVQAYTTPLWWMTQSPSGDGGVFSECSVFLPSTRLMMNYYAWVENADADRVAMYADVQDADVGDCYHLMNLATAVEQYGTRTYGVAVTDTNPPAVLTNLSASAANSSSVIVEWNAPGDDAWTGSAYSYDLRYAPFNINDTNRNLATLMKTEPLPLPAGSNQFAVLSGLESNTTYYIVVRTRDEANNWSDWSTVVSATTLASGGNAFPEPEIIEPFSGAGFSPGSNVLFAGRAWDDEDGWLSGAQLVWSSDVDGSLGTGTNVTRNDLSLGTHLITLRATDSSNLFNDASISIEVANQPPVPVISLPTNTTQVSLYDNVSFSGSANDPEEGALPASSLSWYSDLDGLLAVTNDFQTTGLAPGSHLIRLEAVDSNGNTGATEVAVTVDNQPPVATITAPGGVSTSQQGAAVNFTGSGTDAEDGSLSGTNLEWSSSLDGVFGTGTNVIKKSLSVGTHTITLTALDLTGTQGSSNITLTVEPATQLTAVAEADPLSGSAPLLVQFTGSAFGGPSSNLVNNGDFESGDTGWSKSSSAEIIISNDAAAAHGGSYAMTFQAGGTLDLKATQGITFENGKTYKLSLWYKVVTPASSWRVARAGAAHDLGWGVPNFDVDTGDIQDSAAPWTLFEGTWTHGTDSPEGIAIIWQKEIGEMWLDDFSVTEYGAPVEGASYNWTFGDGGSSTNQSPEYTYSSAGTYTATVMVTDGIGGSSTDTVVVVAEGAGGSGDADSDGLPDSWEQTYFGGTTNAEASADNDSDGFNNAEEYIAGTNPTNGLSYFEIANVELAISGGGNALYWNAVTGRWYALEWSTNLTAFSLLDSNISSPSISMMGYTDATHQAEQRVYYRLNVRQ